MWQLQANYSISKMPTNIRYFSKGWMKLRDSKHEIYSVFPIRDEDSIVGVAQLCNKINGHFDYFDEQVANAFSIYCGISIMHSLVYKKIQDAQARSQLSNELMMYHMQVNIVFYI